MEFLIGFLIFIGIFLLLREFWCWFWKINQRNKLLEDICKELRELNRDKTMHINYQNEVISEEITPSDGNEQNSETSENTTSQYVDNESTQYFLLIMGVIIVVCIIILVFAGLS